MRHLFSVFFVFLLCAGAARADGYSAALARTADLMGGRYAALAESAGVLTQRFEELCDRPEAIALAATRQAARAAILDFARVELVRFGPARENNRFERLFFWPDRRGRGLQQVQRILHDEDDSATTVESLQQKSVAVQGLLALDFVLNGQGGETLALPPAGFRCRYGRAIAGAIHQTAVELRDGWRGPDGFAAVMDAAGPDNPTFHEPGEVAQIWLQAAREQLEVTLKYKLLAVLGDDPQSARPKRLPFWRSGLGIATAAANVDAVRELFRDGRLDALLDEDNARLADELGFELDHALEAMNEALDGAAGDAALLADPDRHEALIYATSPVGGALQILAERYPEALGLITGFNALDGD